MKWGGGLVESKEREMDRSRGGRKARETARGKKGVEKKEESKRERGRGGGGWLVAGESS